MKLRCVIADDESLARKRIGAFLEEERDVEVVAECADGERTVRTIEEHRPDLAFLDVQMPRLDGFEVLEALDREALPAIVFTTAHVEYAIRAFEVCAVDYLLKPFRRERFLQSLDRARAQIRSAPPGARADSLAALLRQVRNPDAAERVLVRSPDRILFVKGEEIDRIESAGNYVILHAGRERHIVRKTMAAMERRLSGIGFMRISRTAIVNLARVTEVRPTVAGQHIVILTDGQRVNMTCPLRDLQARMGGA